MAQGTLRGRGRTGHTEDAPTPDYMRAPGPLREALVLELGFRSVPRSRPPGFLATTSPAPGIAELEFYATQLIDEARHARVFRNHLVELGVPGGDLHRDIAEMSADCKREVLDPIVDFALGVVRDEGDFVGGVAIFTIVIEGVLAPAAELSERKWTVLDPAAGEIARGAAIDEIRHLTVGSSIVREHLLRATPDYRPGCWTSCAAAARLWDELPDRKFVMHREELFQQGMHQHADLVGDYEVWPGAPLLDTTPEERYDMAERWTEEMAEARMAYMGLPTRSALVLTGRGAVSRAAAVLRRLGACAAAARGHQPRAGRRAGHLRRVDPLAAPASPAATGSRPASPPPTWPWRPARRRCQVGRAAATSTRWCWPPTTPDRPCPATAPEVAARLGLRGRGGLRRLGGVHRLRLRAGHRGGPDRLRRRRPGAADRRRGLLHDHGPRTTAPPRRSSATARARWCCGPATPDEPGALGPCVLGSDGAHAT